MILVNRSFVAASLRQLSRSNFSTFILLTLLLIVFFQMQGNNYFGLSIEFGELCNFSYTLMPTSGKEVNR